MTLYKIQKKKISSFTDCLCTDLSWSFAESVHLYWEVDTVWAALSVRPDMLFPNEYIKRNKKKLYVNEKRMEEKNNCLILNKGRFFKANSYFRSVCGTLFVFREIIFCCMWRHFIFNAFLFIFLLIQKHCNTIREMVLLSLWALIITQPSVIYNCFYFIFYEPENTHILQIAKLQGGTDGVPECNPQTGTLCFLLTASSPVCVKH